jgi:hypothetical protein
MLSRNGHVRSKTALDFFLLFLPINCSHLIPIYSDLFFVYQFAFQFEKMRTFIYCNCYTFSISEGSRDQHCWGSILHEY